LPQSLAGLPRRLLSVVYEALLLAAVLFVANFVLLPIVSTAPSPDVRTLAIPDVPTRALLFCTLFAVAALYFVCSWTGGRRTLPMKTWRMRLVDRDGGPVSYKRAFIRYLAAWIGPALALLSYAALRRQGLGPVAVALCALNYVAALADPAAQFLHDRIAGTRIIKETV